MKQTKEIWRPVHIKEYKGFYEVSDLGRVKSLTRYCKQNGYNIFHLDEREGKILTPVQNHRGYYLVGLSIENKYKRYTVASLVAHAFPEICGKPFPGAQINHLNEDKSDNRAINLRFCTASDNINWGTRNQRAIKNLCKPVLQYTLDGEFVDEYPSICEAQRQTGFAQANISKVILGQRKTAYGYIWKYS